MTAADAAQNCTTEQAVNTGPLSSPLAKYMISASPFPGWRYQHAAHDPSGMKPVITRPIISHLSSLPGFAAKHPASIYRRSFICIGVITARVTREACEFPERK